MHTCVFSVFLLFKVLCHIVFLRLPPRTSCRQCEVSSTWTRISLEPQATSRSLRMKSGFDSTGHNNFSRPPHDKTCARVRNRY
ncbi:hypothetical protein DFJ43DRAFT_1103012 [Lentinula guzmanii]|uniref:Secreted protein n=1 Tax=Lentinula guzmanii TaxID=2804957 RepID=A0AA38J847_9AGAR|nr:hypothetical protein DFJ43DRAFT_1103012 [Lentinula guzmanii]